MECAKLELIRFVPKDWPQSTTQKSVLQAEHSDDILEIWDQPPAIQLEYKDKRNRVQRPMHTADYFVFGTKECGWIECKPTQELVKQAESRPNRYVLDEGDTWRCPPGDAYAAKYGLTY